MDEFVDSLVDPSRWPVFTLPLAGDSLLHIVLRNFEDDSGVDYLLEPSPGRDVIQLAALDGHFRGPALAWPELVAAAAQPDPDHTPAERLLLLLPVCADSDRPGVAADVVAKALTAVGARSRVRQVSEELLADGPYRAPAEWITLEGIRYCHGKHAYRSFAGELTLADLRAVTEAFTLPAGWGPGSAGRAGGVVV
ncbi:hypothetical protein ACK8GG_06780 [Micromonosporaceae bacterium DT55]|uniref:hypothetical protein n=1 Tax=Melissospora conviva TaxID=3388432 RepID=UPI003C16AA06